MLCVTQRSSFEVSRGWVFEIGNALHYAHEQGVIHRDVKPSNILVDALGKPWLSDFGLAQIHGANDLTLTGDVLGTLRYMSPEQAEGQRFLDPRNRCLFIGPVVV